jgi:hypothetical protein
VKREEEAQSHPGSVRYMWLRQLAILILDKRPVDAVRIFRGNEILVTIDRR